jgi:demethylmenaquinone methyltransferase/2-methoxy-6-polyprenyl-1,4-benzoquinol methylase
MARRDLFGKSTFDLRFTDHADDPSKKALFTRVLFDEIAHVYDRFALGPISFFQEAGWKRWLVANLPPLPPGAIVDLATGTGVLAFMLAERFPEREVIGVDISERMLAEAARKDPERRVSFRKMDLAAMDFAEESVALFTGGYALRNTPDLPALLSAVHRLLRPGGIAAFLDFSKPANLLHRGLNMAGLRIWLSFWSLLLHRNLRIYNYIPASLGPFPDHRALARLMETSGFEILRRRRFLAGMAEAQIITKR